PGIDQHIHQEEQADQQRNRAPLVRLDVRVEPVRGHGRIRASSSELRAQNFTCGAWSSVLRSSGPTSKNCFGWKPSEAANNAAGNCWMPVLYSCTALLKKRRAAAILFSMSLSSACSCWKFWLALRSG